jgi:hypothetical protein
VEALLFALGLRVIGTPVEHADAQAHQPDGQRGPLPAGAAPEGGALSQSRLSGRP